MKRQGDGESRAAKKRRKNKGKIEEKQQQSVNLDEMKEKILKKKNTSVENASQDYIVIADEDYDQSEDLLNIAHQILKVPLSDVADSGARARSLFEWIIAPLKAEEEFYAKYWQSKPLVIQRPNGKKYYQKWASVEKLKEWVNEKNAKIFKDFELSSSTVNEGVSGSKCWEMVKNNNASLRFFSIPEYDANILKLFSSLEEEFTSMVRGNIDYVPKSAGSFPTRAENFDSFVMQVDGSQVISVYSPDIENPRSPPENCNVSDLANPVLQVTLNPGDFLYLPSGFILKSKTSNAKDFSLSLRFGVNERDTVADLLALVVQEALEEVIQSNIDARKPLPRNFTSLFGVVNADNVENEERENFLNNWNNLLDKLKFCAQEFVDAGIDQLSKRYISLKLPFDHKSKKKSKISLDSKISLIRKDVARLVLEDDNARLYFCLHNSFESISNSLKGEDPEYLEFSMEMAAPIEQILFAYPKNFSILVKDLDLESEQEKIALVRQLVGVGIVELAD
jgi:ribosomal protein L16 Arg81 hydroxylase